MGVGNDINEALSFLSTDTSILTQPMIVSVIDLASIRGLPGSISTAQRLMFESLPIEKRKTALAQLWECRRISHALCACSINHEFIQILSSYFGEDSSKIDFWIESLQDDPVLIVGWKNHFSSTFSDLSCGKSDGFKMGVTVDEVVSTVETVSSSSIQSTYMTAGMYFDLSERIATNGRLIEALSYALRAIEIRKQLYNKIFNGEEGEDGKKIDMWTQVWSWHTADPMFCLSPWIVLRCYLESLLQVSSLYEINGNERDAENSLKEGENLSCLYGLSIFKIFFSSALGSLYQKRKMKMNKKEMEKSRKVWEYFESIKDSLSCDICRWLIRGRILLDRLDLDDPVKTDDKLSLSELLDSIPRIPISCSVSENECICKNMGCWHCMPLDILNSRSVQKLVDLKCQFACRRLGLGLLRRSGNHVETTEMKGIIMRSISMLLNRNHTSTRDWNLYFPLLTQEVTGNALTIEHAELLHYLYCSKIRTTDPSHAIAEGELILLMKAFTLCREVPLLFQKVSRLLAAVLSFIACNELSQMLFGVDVKKLASYVQQVSLGSHINGITSGGSKTQTHHSLAPDSIVGLAKVVNNFFKKIPPKARIISMSVLGQSYVGLLQALFRLCPDAWIMLSCLTFEEAPVVLCMPVYKMLSKDSNRGPPRMKWSGWDAPLVDELAPEFTSIMRAMCARRQTDLVKTLTLLDDRLRDLLKNLEESWFQPLGKVLTGLLTLKTPIILVLDLEIQLLPLESMPMFRGAELYRMPSVGVIFDTLGRNQDQLINLRHGFYLSNPDGEKGCYKDFQEFFEQYFQTQGIKGYAGSSPGAEILLNDLRNEDIYIYLGHNCGSKFILEDQVRKLDKCAAACLLGCESAVVKQRGSYFPDWTPHSYLCAGAPFVICSLWTLYDGDLSIFLSRLFEMSDEVRVGSFIRDSDRLGLGIGLHPDGQEKLLPYMFGAAIVCYGLPRSIVPPPSVARRKP